jgi:hypothetical protein
VIGEAVTFIVQQLRDPCQWTQKNVPLAMNNKRDINK